MESIQSAKIATNTNIGIGVWLILAPFILGYSGLPAPMWNAVVCGVLIVVLGGIRTSGILQNVGLSYTNSGIGAWLIAAPFVLGYSNLPAPMWNDIVVGVLVLVLGIWSAQATRNVNERADRALGNRHTDEVTRR